MVNVVQLVERQFVALVVVGSSPIVHPKIEKKAILLQGGFFVFVQPGPDAAE